MILIGVVLPLCRDAVSVFYSPSRLRGKKKEIVDYIQSSTERDDRCQEKEEED